MIFVTVGTHEQPFNRLVKQVDILKCDGQIKEDVVIQTGYSTYGPKYCTWEKLFPYQKMQQYVNEARIVITHGGPSSFLMPLQMGKVPVVVPRKREFHEHVNNHQSAFSNAVAGRTGMIIVVEDIHQLAYTIKNYDEIIKDMKGSLGNNNANFNASLSKIVEGMFQRKKNGNDQSHYN